MNLPTETLKNLTLFTAFMAVLSLGFFTASAVWADTTYYYVNADGELEATTADMPMEAINESADIMYNSGVIEADEYQDLAADVPETDTTMEADADTYLYVDTEGDIEPETADTPREAINEAEDIKYNSGVIDAEDYYELTAESTVTTSASADSNMDNGNYLYVTADGELATEAATTPGEAINEAEYIMYNSGVITVEAYKQLSE